MEDHVLKVFFIMIVITCFLLVTFIYIYNHHPLSKCMKTSDISPQKLCQLLYEDRKKPPEAFTYDRQADGKYVIYRLDYSDGSYKRSVENNPVDVDGFEWLSKNEGEADITFTKTGFKVAGIGEFNCPPRWSWSSEQEKCIEDPLCSEYNNSIIPLLNASYSEIENPAITIHTKLTNDVIHQKLYIECSKAEKKPIIKPCSENTFVKISQEPYDESKLTPILPLENGEANVNAICKRFDVCENREDYSVHRFLISDESDEPLEQDEYYICKNEKSEKMKCAPNHKVNPDMENAVSNICIPINHCDTNHNFYFRINNDSYGYCRNYADHIVSCDGKGIFHMPDKSIECRNEKCLELNKELIYNDPIFNYPCGIESCFDGNSPKKISCDEMFNELQPISKISNISLPRTKINRPFEFGKRLKEYFEDHEIFLPTKFYYDNNTGKCEPFKSNNIRKFLIYKKMIKDDAVIYKSTSYGMKSLPFRLKDDVMMLKPKDLGFSNAEKVYAIFNGKIYCTGASNEGIVWNDNSQSFYSFISPIEVEPKQINGEIEILDKIYDKIDGIYYSLCIKYHKKLQIMDSTGNYVSVFRQSLTKFENSTTHESISSTSVKKYQIDYKNLISEKILLEHFPVDQFSWNKLFVGKYFYDNQNNNFIIWHDHLFVISVKEPHLLVNKNIDGNGQFIVDNFPLEIISDIYDNNKKEKTWNKTALVTTFNYFGGYFDSPAPFWLSFINIPVKDLTEKNIGNYLDIVYPELKENSQKVLMSIIKMTSLSLNIIDSLKPNLI